ncbi:MAG: type VI secretion system baseplate subunit TssE [Planctomycetes bacterium]|nr:type VI secretion system baseplate subunit TssE [Planctomycetota bacterium]
MQRELTILQRLRSDDVAPSAMENTGLMIRSVQANLVRVLNTREGDALIQPTFGMPPPNEIVHAFSGAVARMTKKIRSSIEDFEPRLSDVEIVHLESPDDPLTLKFQVQARLTASSSGSWVSFMLRFDPSGRITLRQ